MRLLRGLGCVCLVVVVVGQSRETTPCAGCDFQEVRARAARRLPDPPGRPRFSSAVLDNAMRGWWNLKTRTRERGRARGHADDGGAREEGSHERPPAPCATWCKRRLGAAVLWRSPEHLVGCVRACDKAMRDKRGREGQATRGQKTGEGGAREKSREIGSAAAGFAGGDMPQEGEGSCVARSSLGECQLKCLIMTGASRDDFVRCEAACDEAAFEDAAPSLARQLEEAEDSFDSHDTTAGPMAPSEAPRDDKGPEMGEAEEAPVLEKGGREGGKEDGRGTEPVTEAACVSTPWSECANLCLATHGDGSHDDVARCMRACDDSALLSAWQGEAEDSFRVDSHDTAGPMAPAEAPRDQEAEETVVITTSHRSLHEDRAMKALHEKKG